MGRTRTLLDVGAALSTIAALIHAWLTPTHFEEWWGYGLFFLVAAIVQGLLAIALLGRPSPSLIAAGIAANAGIVLLYLVTRTAGIPLFGPDAGEVEEVGVLDLISTAAEIGLIAVLAAVLARRVEMPVARGSGAPQ